MTVYVALLRSVNVGGHANVGMAALRDMLSGAGFREPRSLIQSGNLVFRAGERCGARLERLLEEEAEKRLGLRTDAFVRTQREWEQLIAANPFRAESESDPSRLQLVLLKDAPQAGRLEALQGAVQGREIVRGEGKHAYIVYPDGIGASRLTHVLLEKTLGVRGTGRNWNTVRRLAALAAG